MSLSILLLGLLIGLQHAFEADHLAAISTLASGEGSLRSATRQGLLWGLGHTFALLLISCLVFFSPWSLPPSFGPALELAVGLLLIVLGSDLLRRLWRGRVHIHVHRHDDGRVHLHAHEHAPRQEPIAVPERHLHEPHSHEHRSADWKSLAVGLVHGAAGSAALTLYVAASLDSALTGLVYVLVFGIGSIAGMAILSTLLYLPLSATGKKLTWANRGLQLVIALAAIGIGARLAWEQASVLF